MLDIKFNTVKKSVANFIVELVDTPSLKGLSLEPSTLLNESGCLNIAFVGQYSAGKSSLIKALTGIEDIAIGSGVTTDCVHEYDYQGMKVWDTPGILAGKRERHDEASFRAMDQADLLVYVITNELFDDVVGAAFRNLCNEKGRQKELMLVVNKCQSDSGSEETKLASMAEVLEPWVPEDFPIVFVDVESYDESLDEDDSDDKDELIELSNMRGLVQAIDTFSEEKGALAALTTPLAQVHTKLAELQSKLAINDPTEEALIELLRQKNRILREGKRTLSYDFDGQMEALKAEIVRIGDVVAESIDDGLTDVDFKSLQLKQSDELEKQVKSTQLSIQGLVDRNLSDLQGELKDLESSPLSLSVKSKLDIQSEFTSDAGLDLESFSIGKGHKASIKTQQALKSAEKGLSWLAGQGVNAAVKGGARAASGSNLHKVVLEAGHLFGAKFKPYGAIKIAERIGSFAKFVGPLMAVVGVVVQISDDINQEDFQKKLVETRRKLRNSYREIYAVVYRNFSETLNQVVDKSYDSELALVAEAISDIESRSNDNIAARTEIESIIVRLNKLREEAMVVGSDKVFSL
tara:strand:+ start:32177 stop:33907 length:1731 start_codon:yes stop_codon:yes gene_type:complete